MLLNLTAKFFSLITLAKLLSVKFVFMLVGKRSCVWLVPKATNLWFRRVCQAGVLARVQRLSEVHSLVIYITCHMITVEDSQGNNERPGVARKFSY